jgi:hypothetical protein
MPASIELSIKLVVCLSVYTQEKTFHLGITNTKGVLQFETLEHLTLFNKKQIRTFLELFSDGFNPSAISEDFSLSLSSIIKIKAKMLKSCCVQNKVPM